MSERERIQIPYLALEDDFELTLRPRPSEEFAGQAQLTEQLAVSIEAAIARGEALDHVLLAGPPGLGETSLALTTPLRERFGIQARLEPYSTEELGAIVVRRRGSSKSSLTAPVRTRSRGAAAHPAGANRLLKRTRDYAEVRGGGTFTAELRHTDVSPPERRTSSSARSVLPP